MIQIYLRSILKGWQPLKKSIQNEVFKHTNFFDLFRFISKYLIGQVRPSKMESISSFQS